MRELINVNCDMFLLPYGRARSQVPNVVMPVTQMEFRT